MTTTTDPRTVAQGYVRVSTTDAVKRDALIGRLAETCVAPSGRADRVVARITETVPHVRAEIITGDYAGRMVRLTDAVVRLVCTGCHYSSGHTPWCRALPDGTLPAWKGAPVATADADQCDRCGAQDGRRIHVGQSTRGLDWDGLCDSCLDTLVRTTY